MTAMLMDRLRVPLTLAVFLAMWEILTRLFDTPTWFLPAPSAVFLEIVDAPQLYLYHSMQTLFTTLAGFALAFAVGTMFAIAIVYSRLVENTLFTLLISMNSIPKIALAPLFIIWMGTGPQSKIAVTFLIALFPVVIDMILGLRSTDPDALNLFKTMRGSEVQALLKIRIPGALPHLFAGLKVAISFSVVGAIAGEFIASDNGLGYLILSAQSLFKTDRVFAAIIILGIMGTVLFYLIDLLERLVCPWHVSHRSEGMPVIAGG